MQVALSIPFGTSYVFPMFGSAVIIGAADETGFASFPGYVMRVAVLLGNEDDLDTGKSLCVEVTNDICRTVAFIASASHGFGQPTWALSTIADGPMEVATFCLEDTFFDLGFQLAATNAGKTSYKLCDEAEYQVGSAGEKRGRGGFANTNACSTRQ